MRDQRGRLTQGGEADSDTASKELPLGRDEVLDQRAEPGYYRVTGGERT